MREKLLELLKETDRAAFEALKDREDCDDNMVFEFYADYFVGKGVTVPDANVGKWIPVTERLPEDESHVLAYLRIGEEGRIYPAHYAKGVWWDCIFSTPATKTTTHWMPLPAPPKGE